MGRCKLGHSQVPNQTTALLQYLMSEMCGDGISFVSSRSSDIARHRTVKRVVDHGPVPLSHPHTPFPFAPYDAQLLNCVHAFTVDVTSS